MPYTMIDPSDPLRLITRRIMLVAALLNNAE
jgi:hypothetical protein